MPKHMEKVGEITVPVYRLGDRAFTGLRQPMLKLGPDSDPDLYAVSTGAGLGSDAIWLERELDGHREYACVHGRDLLAARVRLEDPEEADRMPTTDGMK